MELQEFQIKVETVGSDSDDELEASNYSCISDLQDECEVASGLKKKCGEVFLHDKNFFSFLCTLCEAPFEDANRFFVHIESIHSSSSVEGDITKATDKYKLFKNTTKRNEKDPLILEATTPKSNTTDKESISDTSIIDKVNDECEDNAQLELEEDLDIDDNSLNENSVSSSKLSNYLAELSDQISEDELIECDLEISIDKEERKNDTEDKVLVETSSSKAGEKSKIESKSTSALNKVNENDVVVVGKCHTTQKPLLKCSFCERAFKFPSDLKRHERTHTGEKPYECCICEKRFVQISQLKSHQLTHSSKKRRAKKRISEKCSSEKPFKCEVCNLALKTKSTLRNHLKLHTGETKFSCSYCGKYLVSKFQKVEHEATHTGKKMYQCSICGKTFRFRTGLALHENVHFNVRPHKCEYCDKAFPATTQLANHVLVNHTRERSFLCTICSKSFPLKSRLKEHKKTHSDDRKHECKVCGKSFKQRTGLYNHTRSHFGRDKKTTS